MFFYFFLPCSLFDILTSQGENKDFHPDRAPHNNYLLNIQYNVYYTSSMRRVTDESIDLCTSEQREG